MTIKSIKGFINVVSIKNRLIILIVLVFLSTIALTGFIIFKYENLIVSSFKTSKDTHEIQSSAYKTQIYFKTQIQEWKNILLRGHNNKLYKKYLDSFKYYEKKTTLETEFLLSKVENYPALKKNAAHFLSEHERLGKRYQEALLFFKQTSKHSHIKVDKQVRGIDRQPIKLLERIVDSTEKIAKTEFKERLDNFNNLNLFIFFLFVTTFLILITFFWFAVKKGIFQPYREEIRKKEYLATLDFLTALPNRQAYNTQVEAEITRNKRYNTPFTLLVFDLDRFKAINDIHGHVAGDKVLQAFAKILRNNIRQTDFVSRIGGEEFAVLMPEVGIDAAMIAANKLLASIEMHEFHFKNDSIKVTSSCGIAEIKGTDTKEQLFERADAALYQAKNAGRNQCIKGE